MASTAPAPERWTYEQYLELDDDRRYEILDGELLMTPAPATRHQIILSELGFRINQFVRDRDLGQVLFAPTDVVLTETQVVQPDILFVSGERSAIIGERAIHGAPDLVVEILSPSSIHRDRHRKHALYERSGVREYWLVDPANRAIEVFFPGEAGYELVSFAAEKGEVASRVLDGFAVEVAEILNS
jgi:Uma2 family endonuclease